MTEKEKIAEELQAMDMNFERMATTKNAIFDFIAHYGDENEIPVREMAVILMYFAETFLRHSGDAKDAMIHGQNCIKLALSLAEDFSDDTLRDLGFVPSDEIDEDDSPVSMH